MPRNHKLLLILVSTALSTSLTAPATFAADDPLVAQLKSWDANHNSAIDLAEAKKAGEAKFAEANPDNDGTLDAKEASTVKITKPALAQLDADRDGTLNTTEFLALLEERFKAADADRDSKVSVAELKSQAGQALMSMMK